MHINYIKKIILLMAFSTFFINSMFSMKNVDKNTTAYNFSTITTENNSDLTSELTQKNVSSEYLVICSISRVISFIIGSITNKYNSKEYIDILLEKLSLLLQLRKINKNFSFPQIVQIIQSIKSLIEQFNILNRELSNISRKYDSKFNIIINETSTLLINNSFKDSIFDFPFDWIFDCMKDSPNYLAIQKEFKFQTYNLSLLIYSCLWKKNLVEQQPITKQQVKAPMKTNNKKDSFNISVPNILAQIKK